MRRQSPLKAFTRRKKSWLKSESMLSLEKKGICKLLALFYRVNKLEGEVDGIRECLEIANEEKSSLQLQLSEMEANQTEMKEEMVMLDAEKREVERRERIVSYGLENTNQLIDGLKAEVKDQAGKLDKADATIRRHEASIEDAQNEAKIAQIAVQEAQAAQKVAEEALKAAEEAKEAAEKEHEAAKDALTAGKTAEAAEAAEVPQKAAQVADQLVEPEAQEKETEEEEVVQKAPEAPLSVQKVIRQYGHQSRAAPSGRKTRFPRMGNSTLGHLDEESQASAASNHTATSSLPLGSMQPPSSLQRSNSMRRSRSQWFSMHNNSTQSQKRDDDDDNDSMKGSESISSSLSSEVATNDGE
ncbi:hypothetical protein FA10DRAFT_183542 [Acaromyces ingoldii]|uniref:Uncharacterized protein n=1 Tax=Acaromyces ingoldii TaxID=215250 RepID=A0A316YEP8_9BASI|nr:hypothetical protein FA10DRAFT_183542 [Acaromyces ingoldii]PWN87354.1 hypothetical protein FA10DRAFT_183542 [Acaromyces ingoldii]